MNLFSDLVLAADLQLSSKLQMAAIIVAALMVVLVFELVRERKLMERYSLLWMAASGIVLILAVFSGLLAKLSTLLGIATPSNALFAFGLAFSVFMLLHFSVSFSRLTNQNKILAQKLATTDERVRKLEEAADKK